nr:immunoglobulin heavy chain junction region [Macaca mulatta]MOV53880.1 immunoglobulin heavy chain junction region [Macaca mulatta]MOV59756.1 immunoglobulin heavy chain junction region [Macaca mulatta]
CTRAPLEQWVQFDSW